MQLKYNLRSAQILCGLLFLILMAVLWSHIPHQDNAHYFNYADQRELLGIPCFMDVVSNLAFAAVGLIGLWKIKFNTKLSYFKMVVCLGIIWTAVGSGYFHLAPGEERIFWDRLPMSVVFGTILGWLIADKVHFKSGVVVAIALSILGAGSLILLKLGYGDLKPYFLLQYGGLILVILICIGLRSGVLSNLGFLLAFGGYVLAKILEKYDLPIFLATNFISGHTLKHIVSAAAVGIMLSLREKPPTRIS